MKPTLRTIVVLLLCISLLALITIVAVRRDLYREHRRMLSMVKEGMTESSVVRAVGPAQRVLVTSTELATLAATGGYLYEDPLPPLRRGGKVLAYQPAFNTRVLVFLNGRGRVSEVISGAT